MPDDELGTLIDEAQENQRQQAQRLAATTQRLAATTQRLAATVIVAVFLLGVIALGAVALIRANKALSGVGFNGGRMDKLLAQNASRIDQNTRQIAGTNTRAGTAKSTAVTARIEAKRVAKQVRRTIVRLDRTIFVLGKAGVTGLPGMPGAPGPPGVAGPGASDRQVAQAVAGYCAANQCRGAESVIPGPRGQDGPPPTPEQVAAAVRAYCDQHAQCSGPTGPTGPAGPPGSSPAKLTCTPDPVPAVTLTCVPAP